MATATRVEATERKRQGAVNSHGKGDVNLVNLIERFGSEDRCHAYLEQLRWPDGVRCPRCESDKISRITKRRQFDCDSCRYQFSVRVNTIFHDSHLPLWKWFLAVYMMIEAKKGVSANQLKRTLNVSYKTAWYLCHRIRASMHDDTPQILEGTIEVDETYVGGRHKRKNGSVLKNKTMVMGAMERGGSVRFRVERHSKTGTTVLLHKFVGDTTDADSTIYTDQHLGYKGIDKTGRKHETVDHGAEEWVRADVHTNSVEGVWSLFKRSLVGSYHQLSAKHLDAYLDEFAFRFNNRKNPYLFRDTLLALINEDRLTYKDLIEA
ncbi:MAG: IS1595 family transposase [Actinomycetota bacterium]|nr:IS1595 family transposase [Actinomycetota bacterium]